MKLYTFAVPIAVLTVAGVVYTTHSQLTPEPLRSFAVTSVMSSPRAGSPYLHTSTLTRAVRADGSWVESWTRNINGRDSYERMIHDYEAGTYTIVEDLTKSVVKTVVVKDWLAPDLGCFVLQKHTTWTRNSDGFLLVDTKITPIAITFQSVDQYFEMPTSYTERTREQARDLLERAVAK